MSSGATAQHDSVLLANALARLAREARLQNVPAQAAQPVAVS